MAQRSVRYIDAVAPVSSPHVNKKLILRDILLSPFFLVTFFVCLCLPRRRKELLWGPEPIINNKYWSAAVKDLGLPSKTLMRGHYGRINVREDFDLYFDDLCPRWIPGTKLRSALAPCFALLYIVRNAAVVHLPASGGPFGNTAFWRWEANLLRWSGIKTVVIPYGADVYLYSRVFDASTRHGLLAHYPEAARHEKTVERKVRHWTEHADTLLPAHLVDSIGRWDVLVFNTICIDTDQWIANPDRSTANGVDVAVRVVHSPNHRVYKGTDFLIGAVRELEEEGLKIELRLLEGVQNSVVREELARADILAEQFVASAYAMSALEGMASGLPVLSNLDDEHVTRVFRRYGYLDECPVVSSSPETLKQNLRALIKNPELRHTLGRASRQYVEKYHSYETARYMFGSIYDRILHGKPVESLSLFDPLKSEFNRRRPAVSHPLTNNRLPPEFLE